MFASRSVSKLALLPTKRILSNKMIVNLPNNIKLQEFTKITPAFFSTSNKSQFDFNTTKTNGQLIESNYGLRKFIKKTYAFTGGGILSTLGMGMIFLAHPEMTEFIPYFMGGGFVMAMGGIFGVYKIRPTFNEIDVKERNDNKKYKYWYTTNSIGRQLSYGSIIAGMGFVSAPVIAIAGANDILLPAIIATSTVFGGATLYASTRKAGELSAWGPALHGGLFGIVGCGLSGLGSLMLFGPNEFAATMHSIELYAGIPIFAGLIAYDTEMAIDMYDKRNPDHFECSLQLYLDFMNVLIKIIEIMTKFKKND